VVYMRVAELKIEEGGVAVGLLGLRDLGRITEEDIDPKHSDAKNYMQYMCKQIFKTENTAGIERVGSNPAHNNEVLLDSDEDKENTNSNNCNPVSPCLSFIL
jgi:hypothetical protein